MTMQNPDISLSITAKGVKELTPRERQVLLGDADGKSLKEIARDLDGISESAVAQYNQRISEKLHVKQDAIRTKSAILIRAIAYGFMTVSLNEVGHD